MYANGNAGQEISSGGWVKATLLINADGTIQSCFNSTLTASTASTVPCGFAVDVHLGTFDVYLGFPTEGRVFTGTLALDRWGPANTLGEIAVSPVGGPGTKTVRILMSNTYLESPFNAPFYLVAF